MTVGIAAICVSQGTSMIIGASDRMISMADIQAEPQMTKVLSYSTRIVSLIADSTSGHAAIYNRVAPALLSLYPDPTVQQVADFWAGQYAEYRRQQSERKLLAPLGLTSYTLLHGGLSADRIDKLIEEQREYQARVQTIITGVDATGVAHMYVIGDPDGQVTCADFDGYAAIGVGEWHVDSEFMFAGYTNKWEFPEALLLVYSAKKRAEAAPGVGKETDLFMITAQGFTWIGEEARKRLNEIYLAAEAKQKEASDEARKEIRNYVQQIIASAGVQAGSDPTQKGTEGATADEEGVSEGPPNGEPSG